MTYKTPNGFEVEALLAAYNAADAVSTDRGRSRGGWIRLGRVAGSAAEPYVIATRMLKTGVPQLSCGCPDWRFRRQSSGTFCKHQQAVLTGGESRKGKHRVWYYKAGAEFVSVLGVAVTPEAE